MKKCSACKIEKPFSEFHKHAARKDGHANECKQCNKAYIIAWRQRPEVKEKERARGRSAARIEYRRKNEETPRGRALVMVQHAKANCSSHGRSLEFDLDISDVQPQLELGVCAKTGLPFDLTMGDGRKAYGPSIDRIDPTKGYIKGNIQVVIWAYNSARGFWGDEVLWKLAAALVARGENAPHGNSSHENS